MRGIEIQSKGILPALSAYLGETETQTKHTLRDILFIVPWVHRTYCHTYRSQTDMYVPLKHCSYVVDTGTNLAFLRAQMSDDFPLQGGTLSECASGKPHLYQNSWACETARGILFTALRCRTPVPRLSPDRGERGTRQTEGAATHRSTRARLPRVEIDEHGAQVRSISSASPVWRNFCQRSGSNSSIRRAGWVLIRASTSRR